MSAYKLIASDQVVYDLDHAFGQIKLENVFTTEYDCYKLFVTYTGNQSTYKRIRFTSAAGIVTGSAYSYNSNLWKDTGYIESDAAATSHGGLVVDAATTARRQAGMGKLAMTIWQPANTNEKTIMFSAGFSDNTSGNEQTVIHCAAEGTFATAITGMCFEAYGIGEDIENVSYELYGVEL